MKNIRNIILAAAGLGFITGLVSCSDPMDEIKDLTLARNFAPVALTAKVINKTNVKLEWNKSEASSYTIEVFANDSLTFAGSPVKVIEGITANTYTVSGLEGETQYSFRVKAITAGNTARDSKWSTVFAETDPEQILYAVDLDNDVTANAVTLRWPAGSTATAIVATPGDITHNLTADEIAAGAATVTGLQAETAYTFKLMNGTKTRGTIKATTAIDLGGAILVNTGDDLRAKLDAANDGDVFAFMPGTYAILNEEGKVTTYELKKNVSLKSVRANDPAVIKAGFLLSAGNELAMTQIVFDGNKDVSRAIDYTGTEAAKQCKITFEDCKITGFKQNFVSDGKADIVLTLIINNCIIDDVPCNQRFIDFQGGACAEISITNSTLNNITGSDSFIRMDDKGTFAGSPYVVIDHCTINNLNVQGKGIFYIRKGKAGGHTIKFTNNIVSNTAGFFCNFTPYTEAVFEKNNYFNSPNFVEATKDLSITAKYFDNAGTAYDPAYADAEKGDFTVGSDDVKALKIGDPRWLK